MCGNKVKILTFKKSIMNDEITKFYNDITDIYCDTKRMPIDKTRAFRPQFESFIEYFTNSTGTLNDLLKDFYKIHQLKVVNDLSHTLKNRLNVLTHEKDIISSPDEIKLFYESLIRIIYIATKVAPPKRTLQFLNIDQDQLLNQLNKNQKLAVLENKRIVFVNAGPGTGKTHLLVNKIYHYINNSDSIENIVALSYTNTSALELQYRLSEKVFYSVYKDYNILSGTIHSFALKTLRSYAKIIHSTDYDYTILDEDEIDFFAEEIRLILGEQYRTEDILTILKSDLQDSFIPKPLIDKVNTIKKKYKFIGFRDILLNFQNEIQNNPDFVEWLKSQITFILVDEAQDLTKLEYDILDLLIEKTDIKLFLVGDPRQNIFGFNGGSYKHLDAFLNKYKSLYSEMVLDISYRCPKEILEKLNKFEFRDCTNYPIDSQKKGDIKIIEFHNKRDESIGIIDLVKQIDDNKNTAILFTSLKYFDLIAKELNNAKIPFVSVGGRRYLKKYIRLIFHFLNLINNNSNVFSWKYIVKHFALDIKSNNEVISSSEMYRSFRNQVTNPEITEEQIEKLFAVKLPIDGISLIFQIFGDLIYRSNKNYDAAEIKTDIDNLINISKASLTIDDFLTSFALNKELFKIFYKKDLEIQSEINDPNNAITLSTIHSAKGLEWKNVIITGLSDGIFPNPYFCEVQDNPEKTQNNYNDDFKKLYVAMSRAVKNLILTYPLKYDNQYGRTFRVYKSRFLKKILTN